MAQLIGVITLRWGASGFSLEARMMAARNTAAGVLFSLTPAGAFKVLYRFRGAPDGSSPFAGLTDVKGALYETTYAGGTDNDGTVFRFSPKN
jgi:uncharacterized repeat protein (TIGR03803 family)